MCRTELSTGNIAHKEVDVKRGRHPPLADEVLEVVDHAHIEDFEFWAASRICNAICQNLNRLRGIDAG